MQPVHYNLSFNVFGFDSVCGVCRVEVEASGSFSSVTLNATNMTLSKCALGLDEAWVEASAVVFNEESDAATISFEKEFAPGRYVLTLDFAYELKDAMYGFYRSKFLVGGEVRHMASTHFEPTHARKVSCQTKLIAAAKRKKL